MQLTCSLDKFVFGQMAHLMLTLAVLTGQNDSWTVMVAVQQGCWRHASKPQPFPQWLGFPSHTFEIVKSF